MEKRGYKILSIVSIVLNILFVLLFVFVASLGYEMQELEYECAEVTCMNTDAEYYLFDEYTYLCQCLDSNNEIIYSEVLE